MKFVKIISNCQLQWAKSADSTNLLLLSQVRHLPVLRLRPLTILFCAANLGGFSLGTVIGWSSPAQGLIEKQLGRTGTDINFIGSIMPLGAATAQPLLAFILDPLGRKWTMILLGPLFIVGWIVLAIATNVALYCTGRFITGFCGGAFCVAAPTYIGELADKNVRGMLGVFFQLLLVIGILFSYALSFANSLQVS